MLHLLKSFLIITILLYITSSVNAFYYEDFGVNGGSARWTFTYAGYSDGFYWGYSDYHPYAEHEVLSGEFAAAIYWDGCSANDKAIWLTDYFEFPNFTTGTIFQNAGYDVWNDPCNPVQDYDTAYSIIEDNQSKVQIRMDFEVVDLGQNGYSPISFVDANGAGHLKSDRYVLLQTYTIRNISNSNMTGFEFYQFLHGHPADNEGNVYPNLSTYKNSTYNDLLASYIPYNSVHKASGSDYAGNFHYDITQWNSPTYIADAHIDYIGFSSTIEPDFVDSGAFEGGHYYSPEFKPPIGTHINIENRNLNNNTSSSGEVAGAVGWQLGDLEPNETTSITLAVMFGYGEPVVSLEVDLVNVTDPDGFLGENETYCGIDPFNDDPNFYTLNYEIDYSNPVTNSQAGDYLGVVDAVLTVELPYDIWPMSTDVIVSNGGTYNMMTREIEWEIDDLDPGESGTVSFSIKIRDTAVPGGEVVTSAKLSSDKGWAKDSDAAEVCCYCDTVYVDASANGGASSNGVSWLHAYTTLEGAFNRITSTGCGDEIWLAKGWYYPVNGNILNGIPIYGGFAGEPEETSLDDRNMISNKTIISSADGYYAINKSYADNIVLDCVIITGGSTAGIKLSSSTANLNNCVIAGNGASGIELASSSDLTLTKSLVSNNGGNGIYANYSIFAINQTMLRNNGENGLKMTSVSNTSSINNSIIAANGQEGIKNTVGGSTINVRNCSIISNDGRGVTGNNVTVLYNSILWDNGVINETGGSYTYYDKLQYVDCDLQNSCVQDPNDVEGIAQGADTPDQDGNISADPDFYFNPASYVYSIRSTSPCRDTGNNSNISGTTDYYSQNRIINDTVDMGAVEYGGVQLCADCNFDNSDTVDFADFLELASAWLAETNDENYSLALDFAPDGIIDADDLIEFADCWLWEPDFIYTSDVTQIAHRATGFTALEPAQMMAALPESFEMEVLLQTDTLSREERALLSSSLIYEQTEQVTAAQVPQIEPTIKKPKPQSEQAVDIAKTLYLLDGIYTSPANMSEQDYQQYQEFKENLKSAYYELITPQ